MKMHSSFVTLLVIVSCCALSAQTQAPGDSKPSTANVPGAEYPRVASDGRITFQVTAPDAKSVAINPFNGNVADTGYNGLGKDPYAMTRDKDGFWTVTTPPIIPGFHYYTVLVDGASVDDPSSQTFFGAMRELSGVEVPEPGADFYSPKEVQHGEVRIYWYSSKTTQRWERVFVYLPPGYDTNPQQHYPVLYLRHGGGEDETGWINQGHANFILDNLIAAGKAKPMILVMGSGYGGPRISSTNQTPAARAQSMELAVKMAVEELIPETDAHFRTIPDRDHRAIAGLSMGAGQALAIGLANLDKYSAVAAFSRPPANNFDVKTAFNGAMADPTSLNNKLRVFWFGAGTAETGIFNSLKASRALFDQAGIKYTYVEYPNLGHEWQIWRKQLNDFAPLLFQSQP